MNYTGIIKKEFKFLEKDYQYGIDDEENSLLWKYVRYLNENRKRLISMSFDLQENQVSLSFWKLNERNEALDINYRNISQLLMDRNINESLIPLPSNFIMNPDEKVIEKIISQYASILRRHFIEIVKGEEWI